MKKLPFLCLGLLFISLACQALVPSAVTAAPPSAAIQVTATNVSPTEEVVSSSEPTIEASTSTPFPKPEPLTCTDDSCLNACLKRISEVVPQASYEPLTGAYAENEININLVYYEVKAGQLGDPQFLAIPDTFKVFQQDLTTHKNVWIYASSLLPADELKWITRFEVFNSSYYAAWVNPDERDRSHWILGIDTVDAQNPVDLTYILVHEYGHLVSLNTDQIPASDYFYNWHQNSAVCQQLLSPDGCSTSDSYINLFYQKFWKQIFDEWLKTVATPHVYHANEFRELVHSFYDNHSDEFMREYSGTSIKEDLADSFMLFVLGPKPTKNNIVAQKVRFFYDFPELVSLRQHMIQSICSYTGQ